MCGPFDLDDHFGYDDFVGGTTDRDVESDADRLYDPNGVTEIDDWDDNM